jgi:Kef-type K+ transport system membrane component KefB
MDWLNFTIELPVTDPTWIFLLVLLIILFAPLLLNKLRIPHIIGMILAGVLIGEHGLNLLANDSSFELFGKVGLYYIMFLAALEMDMGDLKKNRVKVGVLGVLTFLFPMLMGVVINMSVLQFGFLTSLLLAAMYASHTLVSYPIVIRYGVSRQRSVSIAVGSTAVTDTLTLLVLAMVSGMYKEHTGGLFLVWLLLKFVVLGGLIIFFYPRIGRWFFRRYDDDVMQFIFVLIMVFFAAAMMEAIGMEGLLGAFLAGLVLNRLIPHVSPLMHRLEFVGNALFVPYFLIGVGMMINLRVIFGEGAALKVAGVMIAVALISKWIACWTVQKAYNMKALERRLMYGLSTARAAATLAAVLVGYNIILPDGSRLLNEDVLNGTILLILVTCIVSSLITEEASRKMAMTAASLEPETPNAEEERILIPVANPETLQHLMQLSLLVRDPKCADNLLALNVLNDNNHSEEAEAQGKRQLEQAARIASGASVELRQLSRYDLNIASGIIHTAKENDVTSVIIGLHWKSNVIDSFFGSLAENLLRGFRREVMIAKLVIPLNTVRRINILVPPKAEYEAGFGKWVEHFCRIAGSLGCRIHFFAHPDTLVILKPYVQTKYTKTQSVFTSIHELEELNTITHHISAEQLLVIIGARRGSISFNVAVENLPVQMSKEFPLNGLIVVYPDQVGEPEELMSFSSPMLANKAVEYGNMKRWCSNLLKKK